MYKRLTRAFLTLATAAVCLSGCAAEQRPTLRVLTYNIHHGEGGDKRIDLERIAGVIRAASPDLVALQEVDRGVERSGRVDQPARLAALTGMTAVFEKNIDYQGGEYGNAVLSRLPVERYRNHKLPPSLPREQRGALEVHVRVGGRPVVFFATHLDYHPSDGERLASIAMFEGLFRERTASPVILAGDFNAEPDSPVMQRAAAFLRDAFDPGIASPFTYPAEAPTKRIDYILFSTHPAIRCDEYRVLPEAVASDHRPVLAVLSLDPFRSRERSAIEVARITSAGRKDWPAGLERIEYTSMAGTVADWALALPSRTNTTWVVHIHGHGSTGDQLFTRPDIRDNWLPLYRKHGFGILSVNLRGNAWMSPAAAQDLHALLAFVREHYGAKRFLLAGGSMGGTSNLIYAALYPDDVAAVVALCPATDLASYYQWCRERDTAPVLAEIANAMETAYGGTPAQHRGTYDAHSAVMRAHRLTMPVYVVHGDKDATIPVSQSRDLAKAVGTRPTFRYVDLPDGDHEAPLAHMPEALEWVLRRLP